MWSSSSPCEIQAIGLSEIYIYVGVEITDMHLGNIQLYDRKPGDLLAIEVRYILRDNKFEYSYTASGERSERRCSIREMSLNQRW